MKKKTVRIDHLANHWNILLTAISTVIVIIGVITTSYLTRFETRTRSSAANPTGIPYVCKGNCIYSVGGVGAAATCYKGYCLDPNQSCSFNVNCGWVAGCTGQDKVSCPGFETPTITPTNNPAPTATPTLIPIPTDFFFTPTSKPKNQKYICSSNCESESDGSYKFCYNQCIVEKPGYSQSIGCNGNGWQYGHDQIDTACGATPTPNPREHEPSPTGKVGGPINIPTDAPYGLDHYKLPTETPTITPSPSQRRLIEPTEPPNPSPLYTPTVTPTVPAKPTDLCDLEPVKDQGGRNLVFGNSAWKYDIVVIGAGFDDLNQLRFMASRIVGDIWTKNLNDLNDDSGRRVIEKMNFWLDKYLNLNLNVNNCPNQPDALCWDMSSAEDEAITRCGGQTYVIIYNQSKTGIDGYATARFGQGTIIPLSSQFSLAHELGHSIVWLRDEYQRTPNANADFVPDAINCTLQNERTETCNWPDQKDKDCIETCFYDNWYKPSNNSVMNKSGYDKFNYTSLYGWKERLKDYR